MCTSNGNNQQNYFQVKFAGNRQSQQLSGGNVRRNFTGNGHSPLQFLEWRTDPSLFVIAGGMHRVLLRGLSISCWITISKFFLCLAPRLAVTHTIAQWRDNALV